MSIRKRALSSVWAVFVEILAAAAAAAAAADVLPDEQHLGAGATATARNNLDSLDGWRHNHVLKGLRSWYGVKTDLWK